MEYSMEHMICPLVEVCPFGVEQLMEHLYVPLKEYRMELLTELLFGGVSGWNI